MLNYHEMTMTESRDSPHKRKQFAVTCTIMAAVLIYAIVTSGALLPVETVRGRFPGGSYAHKYTARDYASSGGLARSITRDLIDAQLAQEREMVPQYKLEGLMCNVFLDDPSKVGGTRQRFMSGMLTSNEEYKSLLMGLNDETKRSEFTKDELHEMSAAKVFRTLPYEVARLPPADSLVAQFPWTGGVSSMLVQTLKIIPKLHRLAAEKVEKGTQTVVISMCTKEDQMCTYYAPLVDAEKFLFGRPSTEAFNEALGPEETLNWHGIKLTLQYGWDRISSLVMFRGKKKSEGGGASEEEL